MLSITFYEHVIELTMMLLHTSKFVSWNYLAASLEIKLKPKYCNLLFSKERQTPPFKSRAIEI